MSTYISTKKSELQETVAAGTPQATHGWWHAWPNGLQPQVFPWAKHHSWRLCCVSWKKIQQCHDAMQCVFFPHEKKHVFARGFENKEKVICEGPTCLLVLCLFIWGQKLLPSMYNYQREEQAWLWQSSWLVVPPSYFLLVYKPISQNIDLYYHH